MAYSTDDDLNGVYHPNVSDTGPHPELHIMAQEEIDRRLRYYEKLTDAKIAALSARTKADLVGPSCCWVMYLIYLSVDEDKARFWKGEFEDRLNSITIEVDSDSDGEPEEEHWLSTDLRLG
jgi:hypothetical protein